MPGKASFDAITVHLAAGDDAFVMDVIFLSDNRVVVSGDGGVRARDLETRESVQLMAGPSGYLAATPDDRHLLVLVGEELEMRQGGTVRVHDLEGLGDWELTTHGAKVNALAVDASGTMVATGDTFGTVRFGPLSGGEPHLLLGHPGSIESIGVDPKNRWIARSPRSRLHDFRSPPWSLNANEGPPNRSLRPLGCSEA